MPSADQLLLDTHALLWWQARSTKLSARAKRAIDSAQHLLVSPISFWEVGMLVAKQRIVLDRPSAVWVSDLLADGRVRSTDLSPHVALAAAQLQDFRGDPADRLIYAAARDARVSVVTKDRLLRDYAAAHRDVQTVW